MAFSGFPLFKRFVGVSAVGDEGEIELLSFKVGTRHLNRHLITESVFISVAAPHEAIVLIDKIILIVGKFADWNKTLTHVVGKLHIEAPFRDAGNHAVINLS